MITQLTLKFIYFYFMFNSSFKPLGNFQKTSAELVAQTLARRAEVKRVIGSIRLKST